MYNIRKSLAYHVSSRITCVKSHNIYHVLNTKIAFTKHVTNSRIVIEKHVTTLEKYSPNIKYGTHPNIEKEYSPKARTRRENVGELARDARGERKLERNKREN